MAERTKTIVRHLLPLPNDKHPGREEWAQQKLPDNNPYLIGNFEPTPNEGEFLNLKVSEGAVPTDLRGSYLRVGPNPRFDFKNLPYHAFDGDGFVHAFSFPCDENSPTYVKRWVRTRRLVTSELRGFDIGEMGEQALGSFSYFEHVTDTKAPGHSRAHGHRMGKANTNLVTYANRVFSLEEQDMPYELVASWDPSSHIRTVGRFNFDNKLTHPVTAHPKVDPETGELFFFGYDPISPRVSYSVGSPDGKLVSTMELTLPDADSGAMMHDMVITQNYSLLFDMRLEFSMEAITSGKNPWIHRLDQPARFCVIPRHAKSVSEAKWISVAACAVFHFANAWEEADGKIIVIGCRLPTVSFTKHEDNLASGKHTDMNKNFTFARLHKWVLDPKSGKCVEERSISDHPCDFVQIDPARLGRKTRYVYAQKFIDDPRKVPAQYVDSLFVSCALLKYDLERNTVQEVEYRSKKGGPTYGTEAVFAASETRNAKDEDAGYVVLFTHDESTQVTDCVVYDARTLQLKCRLESPERIPYGFHAHWVPGNVLK